MNRAEKRLYKLEQIKRFYDTIEDLIEYNQKDYESYIEKTKEPENDNNDYYTKLATGYLEKNEVLTELLNEIYKMM